MGSNPLFDRLLGAGAMAAEPPCDPRRFLVSPLVLSADYRRAIRRMDPTRVYQHAGIAQPLNDARKDPRLL